VHVATPFPSAAFHRRARACGRRAAAALLCGLALAACSDAAARPAAPAQATPSPLLQWSPFIALQNGVYGGFVTVGEVRRAGNLGLAAAGRLNGEMVMVGDTFYQFLASGQTVRAPDTLHLAFALAARWTGGTAVTLPAPAAYPFAAPVDALLPTVNWFYALHAHATFACVVARTYPPQTGSPPISHVRPRIDTLRNVTGTVVGFREPPFVGGTSVPGYHLHFINDAHTRGGHVLAFRTAQPLVLRYAPLGEYRLYTPASAEYRQANLAAVAPGPPPPAAGCP
jgi:acetolactate decarboxylase